MLYTVKPIKKMALRYNGNDFEIEVILHPNQKWIVYECCDNLYLSKGNFTIRINADELHKYFREVEE